MKNPMFIGGCVGFALAWLAFHGLGYSMADDVGGPGAIIGMIAGAVCAKALQRSLLGASSGFWHSVPGRWLIGRVAGAAIMLLLLWPVWYGVYLGFFVLVFGSFYIGMFPLGAAIGKAYAVTVWPVTAVAVWELRKPAKIAIGKGTGPFRRWYRSFAQGRGGSAGFASIIEEWGNRWRPGMIFLGHSLHDRHWPVGVRDDRMMMTLAGNGGGKGETAIIPNLLKYPGSVFCNDTKGQNAAVTAEARRRDLGQDVYVLAPFGKETAHLNPLDGIDPEAPDYVERIKGIVEALVIAGDDKNRVWSEWSKIVIEGLIDFEIRYEDGEFEPPEEAANRNKNPTLMGVQALLTDPGLTEKDSALLKAMYDLGGLAEEAAALLSGAADETVGGILANTLSHMNWLKSSGMRVMLSSSDFAPEDINNGNTSVYFALPPEMLGVHERSMRLMANTFFNAAFKGRKVKDRTPTLFVLDEAAAIGALPILPKAAAILRGFGSRAWFIYQSKSQITHLFGKNAETLFANAAQVQVFALNDFEGQQYVEKRLGPRVLWRRKITKTQYGDVVEYEPSAGFSLRGSEEVGRSTGRSSRLQIVLNEGGDAFLLRRTSYRKMFKPGQYAPDPYEPGSESVGDKAFGLFRRALLKMKEWRQ